MRIRTQLIALVVVAIAFALLALAAVLVAARRGDDAAEARSRAETTAHEIADLLTSTQASARQGDVAAAARWHERQRAIVAALESASAEAHDGDPLADLERGTLALDALFTQIERLPPAGDAALEAQRVELLNQLLADAQALSHGARRWREDAATAQARVGDDMRRITVGVALAMVLTVLLIALRVQRGVLLPMASLAQAAAAVTDGDLTFRLASRRADEFGDLARQFDAMVLARAEVRGRIVRSEAQLRAITDKLPAMIAYIGTDRRYQFANERYREWLGRDPASMIGRRVEEVLEGPHAAVARSHVDQALGGVRAQWQARVGTPSGEIVLLAEYIPDVAPDGSVLGCYALSIDVSERHRAESRIARSEQRLVDLMNSIPAMVGYFDMRERCEYANDSGLRSLGIERSELPGLALRGVLGDSLYAQHEPFVREVLQGRRARFDGVVPFQDRPAHFQAHLIPDRVDGGEQRGFYLVSFDITAMKEAQLQQLRIEGRLRAITDNLPVLITYIDRDERFGFANQTMRDWLGIDPAAAVGRRVAETLPAAYHASRLEPLRRALRGERVSFEAESETLGVTRCLQMTYLPDIRPDGSVAGVYTLSTDVTAMKHVEQQLSRLVRSDALTGLPNRYHFNEALPMALARASRQRQAVALMFLDVDRFKSINDTHGHATGDAVLREFASRLRHGVRSTDSVARLAGDEFVITLEGLHREAEAETVARKILALMARPFDLEGMQLAVTTSIGVAYHGPGSPETTPVDLLAQADTALYAAKQAGRNTFRGTWPTPPPDLPAPPPPEPAEPTPSSWNARSR